MPRAPLERLTIDIRSIDVVKNVHHRRRAAAHEAAEIGHMIFVSSVAGHKIGPDFAVYAATKHAVRALAEGFRQEVKPSVFRATIISPGAVDTELPASVTECDVAEKIRQYYSEIGDSAILHAVVFAMSQPEEVDINEILFRPTRQML